MSPNGGGGWGYGVSTNDYSRTHGAQINLGDLTPYLTDVPVDKPLVAHKNAIHHVEINKLSLFSYQAYAVLLITVFLVCSVFL